MSMTRYLAGKESLAIPTAVETESSSSKEFILDLKARPEGIHCSRGHFYSYTLNGKQNSSMIMDTDDGVIMGTTKLFIINARIVL
jgi:hypothetical protein